jgi:hypothetical protein
MLRIEGLSENEIGKLLIESISNKEMSNYETILQNKLITIPNNCLKQALETVDDLPFTSSIVALKMFLDRDDLKASKENLTSTVNKLISGYIENMFDYNFNRSHLLINRNMNSFIDILSNHYKLLSAETINSCQNISENFGFTDIKLLLIVNKFISKYNVNEKDAAILENLKEVIKNNSLKHFNLERENVKLIFEDYRGPSYYHAMNEYYEGNMDFDMLSKKLSESELLLLDSAIKDISLIQNKNLKASISSAFRLIKEYYLDYELFKNNSRSRFLKAVKNKDGDSVRQLLDANKDLAKTEEAKQALLIFANNMDGKTVRELLKANKDLGKTKKAAQTLLVLTKNRDGDSVRELLKSNKDLAKTKKAEQALLVATRNSDHNILRQLFQANKALEIDYILETSKNNEVYDTNNVISQNEDLIHEMILKRISKNSTKQDQETTSKKIKKLESKVCNRQYSSINFKCWLYILIKKLDVAIEKSKTGKYIQINNLYPVIEGIADIHSSVLKQKMCDTLIEMVKQPKRISKFKPKLDKYVGFPLVISILFNQLDSSEKIDYHRLFEFVNKKVIRGSGENKNQLLNNIRTLIFNKYDAGIYNKILEISDTPKDLLKNMKKFDEFVKLFYYKIYPEDIRKSFYEDLSNKIMEKFVSILEIDSKNSKDVNNFLTSFRGKENLITYMTTIRIQPNVKQVFKDFISDNINGTFFKNRYDLKKNNHLRLVFNKRPNLLSEWKSQVIIAKSTVNKKYTVEDTDNPNDLFLIGTEVMGSCQSVHGDLHYNKALMGYVMDGKYKTILVRDSKTGKIQSRSMMRILWDTKENHPVLMIERPYSANNAPKESEKWIEDFAKERAKKLNLPLVSTYFGKDTEQGAYKNKLISFGSCCPFEYVDGNRGIATGRYCVEGLETG